MSDRATALRAARIALIGCGAAATPFRAALRRLGIRPTLCVDTDLVAARRLAGGAAVAQRAAQDFDRFDAAIVTGIGVGSAGELSELTAAAKPVLCGPEVLAAAARGGMNPEIIAVGSRSFAGSHLRFAPGAQRVRSLLKSGRLGSILRFDARLGGRLPPDAASPAYWDQAIAGGGVLTNPGVHVLDLLAWWLGPLTADGLGDDSAGGVEAEAVARISVAGGPAGIVELSRMRALRNSIVLTGTQGRIELDLERMTLRAEPQALLDNPSPPVEHNGPNDRIADNLHRLRLERWLAACVLRTSPVADELADANAIETLIDLYAMRKRFFHPWERAGPHLPSIAAGATALAGRAVLVTGGTGFIGARLVEKLVEQGAKVTVAVRNWKHAARIARLDVQLSAVDLSDPGSLDSVVGGHDVVFSLAYDFKRSGAANLAMHRNLADACGRHGVHRFVHLSSIAVYDDWPSGTLDEASPSDGTGSEYKIAKRRIEMDLAQRAATRALSSAILQPTIVYGPFSTFWTDRFAAQLATGKIVLPRDGLGHCSGVYVEDLVDALLSAAVRAQSNVETWIISGSGPFDWAALIEGYADALGKSIEYDDASELRSTPSYVARIANWRPVRRVLAWVAQRLGEDDVDRLRSFVAALRGRRGQPVFRPADVDPLLYLSKGVCSIAKARKDLGFEPAFDLESGLRRTRDYIRWRYQASPADGGGSYAADESSA